ncbi:hypothetical protein RFI_23150, partial [Reticulomyxa filosa]
MGGYESSEIDATVRDYLNNESSGAAADTSGGNIKQKASQYEVAKTEQRQQASIAERNEVERGEPESGIRKKGKKGGGRDDDDDRIDNEEEEENENVKEKENENEKNEEEQSEQDQRRIAEKMSQDKVSYERRWIDAISEDPKSSSVRVQFANYLFSQHRFEEAQFQFDAALRLDPNNIIALYDLAFMKHHQFYHAFSQTKLAEALECANAAVQNYHKVLQIEENDVETHYQLALLYLTQLETCVSSSIDDISSPIASFANELLTNEDSDEEEEEDNNNNNNNNNEEQKGGMHLSKNKTKSYLHYLEEKIDDKHNNSNNNEKNNNSNNNNNNNNNNVSNEHNRYKHNNDNDNNNNDEDEDETDVITNRNTHGSSLSRRNNRKKKTIGRGRYSPWYHQRHELIDLCSRHALICLDYVTEFDPVAFGANITYARLLYLQCVPPFVYSYTSEQQREKIDLGLKKLHEALEINEMDATLHHDLALLYSHDCRRDYVIAEQHWKQAHELDRANSLYLAQLGYLCQYKLKKIPQAIHYYDMVLQLTTTHSQ